MQHNRIDGERRRLIKLVGAGLALGTLGVGSATAGTGRYIVGTNSRAGTREARRQAESVRRVLDFGPYGQAVAGRFSREALAGLSRRADVRYVEPDGLMYAVAIADLDNGDSEIKWGVDRIDAEKIWDADANGFVDDVILAGAGADVAIIDTGIDNDHPDLVDNLGSGIAFAVNPWWKESSTDPSDWDDGNGHGTHCAGIVAAVKNGSGVAGVAPAATLHAVKVLDNSGSGSWSDVAAGIEWAADSGMDVGSMSLGGGHSETVQTAVEYAASKGVLLVAAAGNDGPDTADEHYPAAYPEVVSVGATERYEDDAGERWDSLAYFSSTGNTVEIGAPGRAITSTYKGGDYKSLSGTSMACPHVSGASALLMANGYTAGDARAQLTGSAEAPVYDGQAGRNMTSDEIGHGMLDVHAAMGGDSGGDSGDTTGPSINNATATDDTDGDGTVGDGDQITVTADVSDVGGVRSVVADASDFGASSALEMTDGDGDGTYAATFIVDASTSAGDGDYAVTITATDTAGNSSTAQTNTLTTDGGGSTGGTMDVSEIRFSPKDYGPGGSFHDLMTTVTIKEDSDGDGAFDGTVSNATVSMTLSLDTDGDGYDDGNWDLAGETDATGAVTFTLKRVSTGSYRADVTNVTHGSLTYDESLDTTADPATFTVG